MQSHLGLECAQRLLEVDFLIEINLTDNVFTILLELDQNLLEVLNLAHEILLIASIFIPAFFSLYFLQFAIHVVQFVRDLCITLDILL